MPSDSLNLNSGLVPKAAAQPKPAAPTSAPPQQPSPTGAGAAGVDLSAGLVAKPGQANETGGDDDPGVLSGIWETTGAPLAGVAESAINTTLDPMLHPVEHAKQIANDYAETNDLIKKGRYGAAAMRLLQGKERDSTTLQLLHGLVSSHVEQAKKSYGAAQKAADSIRMGNYGAAFGFLTEAEGHGVAAMIPGVGPAAAKAGEDIGQGRTGEGIGEGIGLVGSVLAPRALGKVAGKAGKAIERVTPRETEIAGEKMPKLASQEQGAAPAAQRAAQIENEPAIRSQQQQGGQKAIGNIAQKATEDALGRMNEARQPTEVPISQGRPAVPAAEGADTISEGMDVEKARGEIGSTAGTVPDRVMPRNPLVKEVGSQAGVIPDRVLSERAGNPEATTVERPPKFQPVSVKEKPAYRVRDVGEQGIPSNNSHAQATTSAEEAATYKEGRASVNGGKAQEVVRVDLSKLNPDDYQLVKGPNGHDWVKFTKEVPESAITRDGAPREIKTFGDAADRIEEAAQPVYKKLDEVSDGKFTALREQRKAALKVMREPSSMDAFEKAGERLKEAEKGIDDLFNKHGDKVGRGDLKSANAAWRDAKILDRVHAAVDGAFNGVPESVAGRTGIAREISGKKMQTRLGGMLRKMPQAEVERVIGKDGLDNLYRISDLLDKPEGATNLRTVAENVARYLGRKTVATAVGAAVGHLTGVGPTVGAAGGAIAHEGIQAIMHKAATNVRVGKMLTDAAKVGASPKVYAPLIAAEIAKTETKDQPQD